MNEHTKEPWKLDEDGWCDDAEVWENQPRIVACVNACAGLPLERLEAVPAITNAKDWVDTVLQWRDQRDEYRDTIAQQAELLAAHKDEMQDWQRQMLSAQQQRDELLAALKEIADDICDNHYTQLARAAIAKEQK